MENEKKRFIYVDRVQVCDILLALGSVRREFLNRLNDDLGDDEKERCFRAYDKWDALHSVVKSQLDLQDSVLIQ